MELIILKCLEVGSPRTHPTYGSTQFSLDLAQTCWVQIFFRNSVHRLTMGHMPTVATSNEHTHHT